MTDHARALGLAKTGRQNVWIIHPILDSAKVSACLTDASDGVRLLVWSSPRRALRNPLSDDLLGAMRDPMACLSADSPAVELEGYPQLAFHLPPRASNDFAARVFQECANLSIAHDEFRFQSD
ncbi:hypothetical protein OKA04_18665 [Luteolibacter flavescens]|uniref:Uncharacterized protein n=1 Tax=Luteolibacter flavescens TaxID=1859460 RepID=A0ABT3FTZ3_9BACT|nr:hypothetical protein [Luteolibacter flavescens]MCW1886769.1 hypothetical protein [Luteolibacter flavescens]